MFDRFTHSAQKALSRSRQHALRFHHDVIDIPHMLLGLLQEPADEVAGCLSAVGADAATLLPLVETALTRGTASVAGQLPFSSRAKSALAHAMAAAEELN